MVWTKKASAPAYANLAEKVAALVTGGPDAWLMPWFSLVPGNRVLDVQEFCSWGPPAAVEFGVLDFVGLLPGKGILSALQSLQLGEKIGLWMEAKLFEAYCEELTTGAGCQTLWEGISVQTHSRAFEEYDLVQQVDVPPWATTLQITEYLLPGNAQNNAWPGNWKSLRIRIRNVDDSAWAADLHPVNLAQYATFATVAVPTSHSYAIIDINDNPPGNYGVKIEACGDLPGGTFEQPEVEQPDSAIAPTPGTYATIADLGAELDELEKKLHWVLDYTSGAILEASSPLVASELIGEIEAETDIPLGADVAGFIVTCSNIGSGVDMQFGAPAMLHRLGRVVLGNGTAWSPPIEITVSPMLILKRSPFETVCRVQVFPPATATVTTLVKAPLG